MADAVNKPCEHDHCDVAHDAVDRLFDVLFVDAEFRDKVETYSKLARRSLGSALCDVFHLAYRRAIKAAQMVWRMPTENVN